MSYVSASRRAFSLIELVIVVVIIGIIAAIAVPRMSRGAQGAGDSALISNLQILRSSIDLYQTEHGGSFPTVAKFVNQLTTYTDDSGNDNATKSSTYYLGPYLRAVPAMPIGTEKGNTLVGATAAVGTAWIYDATTGKISANASGNDSKGVAYSAY